MDVLPSTTWRQIFRDIGRVTGISATNLIIKPESKEVQLSWREFGMFDIIASDLHDREQIFVTWARHISPVHNAAINGNVNAIKCWFASGVNIDEPDRNGITPLMIAVRLLHVDCVVELIELGANLNRTNVFGGTALHRVAASTIRNVKTKDVVHILVVSGCNPFIQDHDGRTALEIACIWQSSQWGAQFEEWITQAIEFRDLVKT